MRMTARLRRIEEKVLESGQTWTLFSISYYNDTGERKAAEERIIKAYIKQGNPIPTHRIFLREIPSPDRPSSEGFLSSFRNKAN